MTDTCPRCGGELERYELGGREGFSCVECGYVGVSVDHVSEGAPSESWTDAIDRYQETAGDERRATERRAGPTTVPRAPDDAEASPTVEVVSGPEDGEADPAGTTGDDAAGAESDDPGRTADPKGASEEGPEVGPEDADPDGDGGDGEDAPGGDDVRDGRGAGDDTDARRRRKKSRDR
jgi:hypothetical protein